MNPFSHTGLSISDSLKSVRKSVLIYETIIQWVAIPGTSEHQIGIAVDINADKTINSSDAVYTWLAENAHKYGFIKRYPSDKTDITGVINEPWHYRYVGKEAAKEIYSQGICLEEYIDELDRNK